MTIRLQTVPYPVAVDDTYLPMEFRDDQNNLVGFDVDLAKAIGEDLGVKVDLQLWPGMVSSTA